MSLNHFEQLKELSDKPEIFNRERQKLIASFLLSIKDERSLKELSKLQSEIEPQKNASASLEIITAKMNQLIKQQAQLMKELDEIFKS